jgi:hypothetical protein
MVDQHDPRRGYIPQPAPVSREGYNRPPAQNMALDPAFERQIVEMGIKMKPYMTHPNHQPMTEEESIAYHRNYYANNNH